MDKFTFDIYDKEGSFSTQILLLFILALGMIIFYLKKKFSTYKRKRDKLKSLAEEYENKRKYRSDLAYHYYWQLDSGEHSAARRTSFEILQLDEELAEMYENYQELKRKGLMDVKYI